MSDNQKEQNENKQQEQPGGPGGSPWSSGGGNRMRWIWIAVLALLFLPMILQLCTGRRGSSVTYNKLLEQISRDNVEQVTIAGNRVQGVFKQPVTVGPEGGNRIERFVVYIPTVGKSDILSKLQQNNVPIYTEQAQTGTSFLAVILNLLPFAFLIWIFYTFYKRMGQRGQGLFNVGKNKAKLYERSTSIEATLDDVAGLQSAKEEVGEIIDYLRRPEKYEKLGAQTPKGVLLVGPPGTGKTLLARAIAGEADTPFYSMSGSDFMEMFVGVGASRVRNLFKDAKKEQPSIIFIDEIDSIGRTRGAGLGGGHDEREQTLNQLLNELDGFEQDESTVVVAATNRPDILDPALLRPGRFDRQITTNLPPKKDRIEILRIHSRGKPLAESADLETLGANTPGFSGADLENLLNEAALIAVSKGNEDIENGDLDAARDKIILGRERKSVVMSDKEKTIVSYHETGHALVAAVLPNSEPVHKVTIIPREKSMGVTEQLPEEDKYLYEREYIEDRIAVMMGGRAAEQLKAETLTSGAENDLKEAQKLARKMVLDWGMSEDFEHIAMGSGQENVFLGQQIAQKKDYSEDTNRKIDLAVEKILQNAYKRARNVLEEKAEILDKIADTLREEEEVSGEEIYKALEEKS